MGLEKTWPKFLILFQRFDSVTLSTFEVSSIVLIPPTEFNSPRRELLTLSRSK